MRHPAVLLAASVAAAPAWGQLTGNPAAPEVDPWRVVLGTVVVALLTVAVLLLVRRQGVAGLLRKPPADAVVRMVSRTPLDARNAVVVVEAGTQRWLLGVGPQGPQMLAELRPAGDGGREAS